MLSSKLYLPAATLHAMCSVLSPMNEEHGVEICIGVSDNFFSLEMKLLCFSSLHRFYKLKAYQ